MVQTLKRTVAEVRVLPCQRIEYYCSRPRRPYPIRLGTITTTFDAFVRSFFPNLIVASTVKQDQKKVSPSPECSTVVHLMLSKQ